MILIFLAAPRNPDGVEDSSLLLFLTRKSRFHRFINNDQEIGTSHTCKSSTFPFINSMLECQIYEFLVLEKGAGFSSSIDFTYYTDFLRSRERYLRH